MRSRALGRGRLGGGALGRGRLGGPGLRGGTLRGSCLRGRERMGYGDRWLRRGPAGRGRTG